MAKLLKLTGLRSFHHKAFVRHGDDAVHVRKGEVIKVDDDLADYLLEDSHRLTTEDVRYSFTEVDGKEKVTYDFSTKVATGAVGTASVVDDAAVAAAPAAAPATPHKTQRRARGA